MAGFFSGRRGKKREINAVLNLVPFIDLFSAVIIFLISTAVWDQLAAVPVNLGAEDKASLEAPKEELRKIKSNVYIEVNTATIETFDEGKRQTFPRKDEATDYTPIDKFVAEMREKYPAKKDMLIRAQDQAVYEDLIAVMDRCLGQKFEELIVTGADQKM